MNPPAVPTPPFPEEEAEARLRQNRQDVEALLAKADHRFTAGDHKAANAFYNAVVRLAKQTGTAPSREMVTRAQAMTDWCAERFKQHLLDWLDQDGHGADKRHPRFQSSLEMMLGERERPPADEEFPQTPLVYYYPDLPYVRFADPAEHAWIPPLQANWQAMRGEAQALLGNHKGFQPYIQEDRQRPQGDVHGMLENPDWSTLYLWQNGGPVAAHVARCPNIFEAVMQHVPLCNIGKRAPTVMLSLLRPGAHIPPHTGMLNSRYICHLPLIVPPDCGFRVGEETIQWEEGKVILFDDTVQHEAWNDSDQDRLVLIFDVWRPEVSEGERAAIRSLFDAVDGY